VPAPPQARRENLHPRVRASGRSRPAAVHPEGHRVAGSSGRLKRQKPRRMPPSCHFEDDLIRDHRWLPIHRPPPRGSFRASSPMVPSSARTWAECSPKQRPGPSIRRRASPTSASESRSSSTRPSLCAARRGRTSTPALRWGLVEDLMRTSAGRATGTTARSSASTPK